METTLVEGKPEIQKDEQRQKESTTLKNIQNTECFFTNLKQILIITLRALCVYVRDLLQPHIATSFLWACWLFRSPGLKLKETDL